MNKNTLKTLSLFILAIMATGLTVNAASPRDKIVMGGSGWNQIAVVDKQTGRVEWTHDLEKGNECNTVSADKKGNVLYSYKQGARLIDRGGNTIWDYRSDEGTEVQYAALAPKGYVLGICGNPSRIVELDKKGQVTREITFETGTKNPHGQFRQVWALGNGSYLVALLSQSAVITVNSDGEITNRIAVEGKPFSVKTNRQGNLIVSGGDGHCMTEVTPQGEVVRRINQNDIDGIVLGYIAQINPSDNGNWLICNWLGHGADATQPHLIEIDPQNKVIWRFNDKETVQKVSTAYQYRSK